MYDEKTILNYYEFVHILYVTRDVDYEVYLTKAEKTFKGLMAEEITEVLAEVYWIESFNYNAQNSLIIWYLLYSKEKVMETNATLRDIYSKLNLGESLIEVTLATETTSYLKTPVGFKYQGDVHKNNFLLSRAIFMGQSINKYSLSKENIVKLLDDSVNKSIQKSMRYLYKLRLPVVNTKTENMNIFDNVLRDFRKCNSLNKEKADKQCKLDNLSEELISLQEEYRMEEGKLGI